MTTIVAIPEEVVNRVQALDIETESRKNLIAYMLSSNLTTATEQFEAYQKEYRDFYYQFDIAKSEIERDYVRTAIENPIRWELNYSTGEVTIYH